MRRKSRVDTGDCSVREKAMRVEADFVEVLQIDSG